MPENQPATRDHLVHIRHGGFERVARRCRIVAATFDPASCFEATAQFPRAILGAIPEPDADQVRVRRLGGREQLLQASQLQLRAAA